MIMTRILLVLLFVSTSFTLVAQHDSKALNKLAQTMAGQYANDQQAASDTNFFHISLVMKPIWKDRKDGPWLYVEQAIYENQAKPYRQRIYHLEQKDDSTFVSHIYTFNTPLAHAGDWKQAEPFSNFTKDSIIERSGCEVILHLRNGAYVGSTVGDNCGSDLRGAAYATSEVSIVPGMLISLDRGYNTGGAQVWGSQHGGYRFEKKKKIK
jgi:hypothetical protein